MGIRPAHPPLPWSVSFSIATQAHISAIALGANLGDRAASIAAALAQIAALPGVKLLRASAPIETDPVGPIPQPRYLNAAALIQTSLSPRVLLNHLLAIERRLGRDRTREERWGPRTLDLDLLLCGDHIIDEPGLTIPHPRMHERLFVLEPLAAIAPDLTVPGQASTIAQLRDRLRGTPVTAPGSN